MGLAITEDHAQLARVTRDFLEQHSATRSARNALDADTEVLPAFWDRVGPMGWLGLHIAEEFGGDGFTIAELAVVVEQFGRAAAPGPLLACVTTAAVLAAAGTDALKSAYLPALVSGELIGALGLAGQLHVSAQGTVDGAAGPVLSAGLAGLLVLRAGADLVVVRATAAGVAIVVDREPDPSRRCAQVTCTGVRPEAVLPGAAATAVAIARTLAAAEATGIAGACTDMATGYANAREQFGRAIGTFQAVKHTCANMFVDTELAVAAAWGAARSGGTGSGEADLAAATAYSVAVRAALTTAQRNIQVHGGIGFTWEHDAGLYLRRACALRAVFGAPQIADAAVAASVAAGVVRRYEVELPAEAQAYRAEARELAARVAQLPRGEQRVELVASGYLTPHWPPPWGLGASAVQQLVIDEEFAEIRVPALGITGWNVLTIIQHGSPDQLGRWVEKSLLGELLWCQLFSEPGAGSDAAAIRTAGRRVDGGWRVTGQKVWTSGAHRCQWGFATVRTDSSGPKHTGVTMMAIDMSAAGVDVRPLRELTGNAAFNEVFLDDVFVPDDDVVGEVGQGWAVARATLGNERVSIGGAPTALKIAAGDLIDLVARRPDCDAGHLRAAGALVAEEQALTLLNLRQAVRAVEGAGPGPEGNVTKLVRAEHGQRVTEFAMDVVGPDIVGGAADVLSSYLLGRCYTIAGGTSEIVRNQIAERIMGLPRDPLLQ